MWKYFTPPITAANLRLSTHNHWLHWVSLSYVNQMEKSTEMGSCREGNASKRTRVRSFTLVSEEGELYKRAIFT